MPGAASSGIAARAYQFFCCVFLKKFTTHPNRPGELVSPRFCGGPSNNTGEPLVKVCGWHKTFTPVSAATQLEAPNTMRPTAIFCFQVGGIYLIVIRGNL